VKQEAVLFGEGRSLSGVVTYPDRPIAGAPAVVFLTAGVIHRVGPNRLYARLCQELAGHGFLSLRFDFSGIGDSLPRADSMVFSQSSLLDTKAAMDFLSATTGARKFVTAGLCSGAFAAVNAAMHDPRVRGAIVINAQTLQDGDQNEFQAFAFNRSVVRYMLHPRTWLKVFDGTAHFEGKVEIVVAQLRALFRKRRLQESARAIGEQLERLTRRNVDLLFVYSKGDPGLEYFRLLGKQHIGPLLESGRLQTRIIPGTDHIFAPPEALARVRQVCIEWLEQLHSPAASAQCDPLAASVLPAAATPVADQRETVRDSGLSLSFDRVRT
jgi:pimeloyl-ACP methyl ester carboxylesterase